MRCPLLCAAKLAAGEITQDTLSDCYGEECAWWNRREAECAIFSIARELYVVKAQLYEVASKMPHAGQFLK